MSTLTTQSYTVTGMSCGHCASSVHEEVSAVDGVHDVRVELHSGLLTVSGDGISDDAVHAAVAEAGYSLVR